MEKNTLHFSIFHVPGEATQLDLGGDLYIGSVDYMDPQLRLPPAVWSGTLRYGFVGCLQEFFMNGAAIDVVQVYTTGQAE